MVDYMFSDIFFNISCGINGETLGIIIISVGVIRRRIVSCLSFISISGFFSIISAAWLVFEI